MNLTLQTIKSLPAAHCARGFTERAPRLLQPVWTEIRPLGDASHLCSGATVWSWEDGDTVFALGWEWVEFRAGVVLLANPMEILSNMKFDVEGDQTLPRNSNIETLNIIVHSLPWLNYLRGVLNGARDPSAGRVALQ